MEGYIRKYFIVSIFVSAIIIAGFYLFLQNNDKVQSNGESNKNSNIIRVDANVQKLDILMLESFPLQVQAVASGFLPDSCTTIDQTSVQRDGNSFYIDVKAVREADAICTQVVTPFEEKVSLDVLGLDAGMYNVYANDASASFEFTTKNQLP